MTHEQKFLAALKSIFIGAKVEGDSGYINLMKIKANYFEKGVFPVLMKDIDSACKPFTAISGASGKGFREELFDKLYDFFQHYFSESGSIYFRNTAQHHNIYEKVYTDDRDVMLFWKTHMLYYVKTDRLFSSMEIEVDGEKFFFDVSGMELKRSNEKRELTYAFKSIKNGVITLTVGYSEKGRKTKIDEIVKAVKDKGMTLDEETLEKALAVFQKQSEVDYFINKNAKAFLQEQFDLWMYQYIFKGESDFNETRLKQLQAIKGIAYKIIDFIAQFEDELVKIWNKPKFVLNSAYIITLDHFTLTLPSPSKGEGERAAESLLPGGEKDRMRGESLLKKIFKHKGMKDQIAEWIELGMIDDETFRVSKNPTGLLDLILEKNPLGKPAHPQYGYLPLDTKYFKDLELDILALFDDLDSALDGWLIHSENYQALNTIVQKFRRQVKCIYIDPPYNAEGSEILYVNKYRSSSWLSLMQNRLDFTTEFLQESEAALIVAIDDYESANLTLLLKNKFPDFEINPFVINHHPQGSPKANISRTHEYSIMAVPKSPDFVRTPRALDKPNERPFMRSGTGENNFRKWRPNSFYAILIDPTDGTIKGLEEPPQGDKYPKSNTKDGYLRIYPIDGSSNERVWRKTYKSAIKALPKDLIFAKEGRAGFSLFERVTIERVKPISNWFESKYNAGTHGTTLLTNLFGVSRLFAYPKSLYAEMDLIDTVIYDDEEAITLDYFGGSGTTAHSIINFNRVDDNGGKRRYILVEMGSQFVDVIVPRVKKVVFSENWKDGFAQEGKGTSHFAKYFELEQYEDALKKARYEDAPLFAGTQDAYTSYAFLRDLKMLEAVQVDKKKNKVEVNLEKLYEGIDLAETLSCLTGKWIKRITKDRVEFQDGTSASLSAPEWDDVRPLIWW